MNDTLQNPIPRIPFRQRLAVRLLTPLVLLVLSLVSVISLLVWYSYRGDVSAGEKVPVEIAETMNERIENFYTLEKQNLSLAVRSISLSSFGERDRLFLSRLVEDDSAVNEIVLTNATGTVIFRTVKSTAQSIVSVSDPEFIKSRDRVIVSRSQDITEPYVSEYNTPYLLWTVPIYDNEGAIQALLTAVIDVSTFWSFSSSISSTDIPNTLVVVSTSGGAVLVSSQRAVLTGHEDRIRDILFNHSGSGSVEHYSGVLGSSVVGRVLEVKSFNWYVIAEVPVRELMVATERNIVILVGMLLLITLLAVYTFFSFEFYLSRPLAELSLGVYALSQGNYKTRIALKVQNELSRFAEVMNIMAKNVDSRTSEIVTRLKRTITDLDRSAKSLMKRDDELSRANERLQNLDHAKSEFVSIAAHQLRTPLSALKWAQQMLLEGEMGAITPEQTMLLKQSQESVQRMVTLVNDLLAADHLEYGTVSYNFTQIDSETTLISAVSELKPMADERRIIINFDPNKETGKITADPDRIKEAFLNILNNAIKYTPNSGTITVRIIYGMGKVVYSVADTGIGIPPADRDRLFEKFVRMDNAKKVDANGTGLGLFIVKKIIDAHNGRIWFDSIEGKGTTFFIELPLSVLPVHQSSFSE